jgi:hypothetical protein
LARQVGATRRLLVLGSARASRAANDALVVGIGGTETAPRSFIASEMFDAGRVEPHARRACSPFPPSAIIKRPPLPTTARRAGWVGCNFDLSRVPAEARIEIISTRRRRGDESLIKKPGQRFLTSSPTNQTVIIPPEEVREKFQRVKPLKDISN